MKDKYQIIERYKELVYDTYEFREQKCIKFLKKYPFLLETCMYSENETPFLLACERQHQQVIDYLISKNVNIHLSNVVGENGIFFAVHSNNLLLIEKLHSLGLDLNQKNHTGSTPLLEACMYNLTDMIKFLVENGADVNAQIDNTSLISLLLKDALDVDFKFFLKHLDKFNEQNRKKLKGLKLKKLVTKGSI